MVRGSSLVGFRARSPGSWNTDDVDMSLRCQSVLMSMNTCLAPVLLSASQPCKLENMWAQAWCGTSVGPEPMNPLSCESDSFSTSPTSQLLWTRSNDLRQRHLDSSSTTLRTAGRAERVTAVMAAVTRHSSRHAARSPTISQNWQHPSIHFAPLQYLDRLDLQAGRLADCTHCTVCTTPPPSPGGAGGRVPICARAWQERGRVVVVQPSHAMRGHAMR